MLLAFPTLPAVQFPDPGPAALGRAQNRVRTRLCFSLTTDQLVILDDLRQGRLRILPIILREVDKERRYV